MKLCILKNGAYILLKHDKIYNYYIASRDVKGTFFLYTLHIL